MNLRGSMTDPPPSTMAATAATDLSRANSQARTSTDDPPAPLVTKNLVTRDFDLTIRAFFPPPSASAKFNPIHAMNRLFRTMLKDEPSLVLRTPTNDKQLILATNSLPTGENEFKKYFKVSTARSERQKSSHVCIGCHVLSNRSLGNIKFRSSDNHLLAWLKQERVFLESDGLGTERPITIGYFTKIAADLTHLANFRDHLVNQLMLVDIDATTAIELAPYLKTAQIDAMSNGDDFVPILPAFEIYRTHLSHGREPAQVKTDVLGVKCAPRDAKLLTEFFTRMASETNNVQRDGVFLPKGAVHLLGPTTYEQVLKEHNFFLTTVATIPINLEHRAWYAIIDPTASSDTELISLHDHLIRKSWFLRIEEVDRRKCFLVTTKPNLPAAREWVDTNLEPLIRKSIPEGTDPPSSQLPRRLDKPVYSASSRSYADALKKQFSLTSNATTTAGDNTRPPRKRQAAVIDYDSDTSNDATAANAREHSNGTIQTTAYASEILSLRKEMNDLKSLITAAMEQFKIATAVSPVTSQAPPSNAMATDVESPMMIKSEIAELKNMLTTAVEQFKTEIASLTATPQSLPPNAMETESAASTGQHHPTPTSSDLAAIVNDLKHELAAFVTETRTLLQQQNRQFTPFVPTPFPTLPT